MTSQHSSLELNLRTETGNPTTPTAGDMYYNTSTASFVRYDGTRWSGFLMSSSTSTSTSTSSSTSITTSTSTTSTSTSRTTSTSTSISTSTTTTI